MDNETLAFMQSAESMPDLPFEEAIAELKKTGSGVLLHPDFEGDIRLSKLGTLIFRNFDGIEAPWPDYEERKYRENKWFHIPF